MKITEFDDIFYKMESLLWRHEFLLNNSNTEDKQKYLMKLHYLHLDTYLAVENKKAK
jgi:hypothetical protein